MVTKSVYMMIKLINLKCRSDTKTGLF